MAQVIKMEKWENGGGVTLRIKNQYDPEGKRPNVISLDFTEVDNLLGLLKDYKAHPSPFCLTEICPIHGKAAATDTVERIDFLASVIVTVFEGGGVQYWSDVRGYRWSQDADNNLLEASAEVKAFEWEKDDWRKVGIGTVSLGIQRIKEPEFRINPAHLSTILTAEHTNDAGEVDAEIADCIVQAGLLGELVYG